MRLMILPEFSSTYKLPLSWNNICTGLSTLLFPMRRADDAFFFRLGVVIGLADDLESISAAKKSFDIYLQTLPALLWVNDRDDMICAHAFAREDLLADRAAKEVANQLRNFLAGVLPVRFLRASRRAESRAPRRPTI